MSRRTRKNKPSRRLALESLEGRSLLAGDVLATLSSGSLILTGDSDDNSIVITADANDPGRVTLSSGDGTTTINGSLADQEFTFAVDLRASMKAGDDIVEIVGDGGPGSVAPRDVTIDLGSSASENEFHMSGGFTVTRTLRVAATTGHDLVTLDTVAAGDLYFSLGNDGADVTINEVGTTKAMTFLYGNSGGSSNTFNGTGFTAGTSLTLQTGTGTNEVHASDALVNTTALFRLQGSTDTLTLGPPAVQIGNTLNIALANGDNNVALESLDVTGATFIKNGNGASELNVTDSAFHSSLTVTNGTGANTIHMIAAAVGKAASILGGAGTNTLTIDDATFDKTLVVTHGNGDGSVQIGQNSPVSVASTTSIRQGNAAAGNEVLLGDFNSMGALNIINGNGGAVVHVGSSGYSVAAGSLSVKNGNSGGNDNFVSVDAVSLDTDATLVNGTTSSLNTVLVGVDQPVSVGRHLTIRQGNGGASTTMLNGVQVTGNLIIATGSGDDSITLENIGTGDLEVTGSTTIDTLAGSDTLLLGGNNAGDATFDGYFTARMGNDDDTVTVGEFAVFPIAHHFLFDGGLGTDTITVVSGTSFDPITPLNNQRLKNFTLILT